MSFKTSVALCTYNGSDYIEEQIYSIINQTVQPDEIIISDDSSEDGTVEVIKKILEKSQIKYKIFTSNTNLGVIKNFEKAIFHCSNDIIFTSDQDDVWLDDKIEHVLKLFYLNDQLSVVFTDAYLVDKTLLKTGVKLWDTVYRRIREINTNDAYFEILLKNNIMTGATMAFKNSLFKQIYPFNEYWIHDYWIAITGSLLGHIQSIPEPLILYRQHDKNVIGATSIAFSLKIKKYIDNFKHLKIIRHDQYNKFYALQKFCIKLDDDYMKISKLYKIEQGLEFWKQLSNLDDCKKYKAIKIIFKEYIRGNYNRYYTGFRGMLRDLISSIID